MVLKTARTLFAWLALIAGLAFAAGEVGGLWGTNTDWRAPEDGVTIFVETNGFHTGFILPARAEGSTGTASSRRPISGTIAITRPARPIMSPSAGASANSI